MCVSRAVVRLRVGHRAEMLDARTPEGYTHRWTLYVRSAGPHEFVDRSFVTKVVFVLHPDFTSCRRVVNGPPFQVTECGFAGFSVPIYVHFSSVHKALRILYDMRLYFEKHSEVEVVHTVEISQPPIALCNILTRYGGTLKANVHERKYQPSDGEAVVTNANSVSNSGEEELVDEVEYGKQRSLEVGENEQTDQPTQAGMKGAVDADEFMKQESLLEVTEANTGTCARNQDEQIVVVKSGGGTERLEMYQSQNIKCLQDPDGYHRRTAHSWWSNEKGLKDICSKEHVLDSIPRVRPINECVPHEQHSPMIMNDNSGLTDNTEETLKRDYRAIDDTEIRNCQETSRTAMVKKVSPKRGRLTRMRKNFSSTVTDPEKGLNMELRRRKRGHVQEPTAVSDEHIEPQYGIETEHNSSNTVIVRQRRCTRKSRVKKDVEKGSHELVDIGENKELVSVERVRVSGAVEEVNLKRRKSLQDEINIEERELPVVVGVKQREHDGISKVEKGIEEMLADEIKIEKDEQEKSGSIDGGATKELSCDQEEEKEPQSEAEMTDRNESFSEKSLRSQSVTYVDVRQETRSWATRSSSWDGTEGERLVRLREGLTRICDAGRLRALIDAVVDCEPSSLREAGMRFSEDGKLSFDLSALTPALCARFEQICFGKHKSFE